MKMHEYPEATVLDGTEVMTVVQGGYTRTLPVQRLVNSGFSFDDIENLRDEIAALRPLLVSFEEIAALRVEVAALRALLGGGGGIPGASEFLALFEGDPATFEGEPVTFGAS